MATFGPIASASPNILFDPARVDAQVQGFQRNQLLMQNAQQDQQQQTYQRDTEARIGLARQLVGMPEDQAAAAWGQERQRLQAAGFGRDLPEQFPGLERLKSVAASDLTTFQRLQIEEKRRQSEALAGLFGGVPAAGGASMGGATPGYTPASMSSPLPTVTAQPSSGGNVRTQNANYAQMRQEAMDTLEGDALAKRLAEISAAASADLTGTPAGTQYRANPGSTGAFAGMPAPAAGVPVLGGGQAAATPASSGGLTAEQQRLLAVTAQTNPGAVPGLALQIRSQNSSLANQEADNRRRDAQFEASQRAEQERLALAREAADRARRREGLAENYEWIDPSDHSLGQRPIKGGAADPEQARALASARRTGAPIPPFIQKAEQEDIDAIQTASSISSDLTALGKQIVDGKLDFGLISNPLARAGNFIGVDSEAGRNLQSYRATMTRIVNDSLRLNKGVQTDGDAQRAAAELMDNINSPGVVKQRLEELGRLNQRAVQYRTALINRRRAENGLPETDVSAFTNIAPAVGQGTGGGGSGTTSTATTTQASAQGGGWSIRPVQ